MKRSEQIQATIDFLAVPFVILLIIAVAIWFFGWLNKPMKVIYDPNAPPYPCDIGACEDPRR